MGKTSSVLINNQPTKILVVDNQPNNLRFLSNMLTKQGYKVQRAISGQLALNAALAAPPDLILLDIIMPQMNGYEVCQRLKVMPATKDIPIIFLSALSEVYDKVKAFKLGGVDYITKPFQVEEVLARIENQLTIQKLQKQCNNQNLQLRQEIEERVVAELKLQRTQRELSALTSELKLEKERFELVVQASNNGFWDWNLESGELYLSPRWKEMLGYSDEELPNELATWENLIFPEDKIAAYKLIEEYNTGRVPCFEIRQRFDHKNGSTVYILSRAIHLKNEAGKVVRMIGAHINITETINTLKALQQSQSLLEGVLNSSLDAIMAFSAMRDISGEIIDFQWLLLNPAAERMVGSTSEDLVGKQLLVEMPGNLETGLFEFYVSVVETGRPQERELYYEHEGIEAYLQIVAVKLGDGFAVTVRDITQRRQAEERLKLLERAVATSSNGIVISDAQTQDNPIIYVNSGFERMTGYSAEEVVGKNCRFLQGGDKPQQDKERLRSALNQGQEGQFILCNYRKDGKPFWNEFSITPIRDETGRLTHYIGIQTDITERVAAEQALRESEARFRAMADSTSMLMWVAGVGGQCTFFNKTWLEFTGRSLEEELGSGWLECVHPNDQQYCLQTFLTALLARESFELEYRLLHTDGEYRWIVAAGKPRFTPDGSFAGYIGSGFDITERKQAELELENAKAAMGRQIQRVLLLQKITQEIRSSLKPEEIFQTAATQIGQAFQVNSCLIHTYIELPPPRIIGVAEYKQPGIKSIQKVEFPVEGNPHAQKVLAEDRVVVSDDVYTDPLLAQFSRLFHRCGLKSMLAVRTSYQGKPNGMISIHQCDCSRHWKKEEIELLELVANQMGIAIAQANLLEQEKHRRREQEGQNQRLQQEIRERQLVEEALKKSEERWQLALCGTGDGIWDWNIETDEVFLSVRWKEMLGYENHEIGNHKDEWHSRIHPEDLVWVMDAVQDHLDRITTHYSSEHRLRCKNGNYRWFLARGQAQWDATGKPIRLLGSITDITEGKLAEETLQRRANRDSLLSSISRQFLDRDLDSAINYTLQAIGEFLGSDSVSEAGVSLALRQADRCYVCQYHNHQSQFSMTYEWCSEGIEPSIRHYQEVKVESFPWLHKQLTNHNLINIPLVAELPRAAKVEKAQLQELSTQSLLIVPMSMSNTGKAVGFIGVETVYSAKVWTQEDISLLRFVGELIAISQCRHQAQEQLRASQQRLSFLVEQTPLAVIEFSTDWKVVAWNPAAEQIFGYTSNEVIGNHGAFLVPESSKEEVHKIYNELLTQPGSNYTINENLTKDGKVITCEWYNVQLMDENSSVIGFASIAVDITERQQRELLRKVQNKVLRMVAQDCSLYEVLLELTRQVTQLAPYMGSSILLSSEDGKFLHPYVSQKIPSTWEQVINPLPIEPVSGSCGTAAYFGMRMIVEDVATDPLCGSFKEQALAHNLRAWWSEPIKSDTGKVLGTFAMYLNELRSPDDRELEMLESLASIASLVIQRKQAEAELRQAKEAAEAASHAKSQFLSKMTHELRTPLNAILGFTQVMARDNSLKAEHQEHLVIINRSGEHLLELINEILSMSKIEAGQVTLQENRFDLYQLLYSIEEMLRLKANFKGLQLFFNCAPDLPQYIQTDEGKLRQVLINLLGNAIKFTTEGSVMLRVKLGDGEWRMENGEWRMANGKTEEKGEKGDKDVIPDSPFPNNKQPTTIIFEVEDTGPGIAPEELHTLFDPFVQTQTGRQSMKGTGLGLTISQQFVHLMGGEINVNSTLSQGTTFTFTIQVSKATTADNQTITTTQRVIGLEPNQPNYRILVVEDVVENRKVLIELFKPLGFELQEVSNGEEAIALWESWQPHLIWMDIQMPVMDGYEATRQIKARERQLENGEWRMKNGDKGEFSHSQTTNTIIIALTASAFEEQQEAILSAGCDDFVHKPFREEVLFEKMATYLGVRYTYEENLPAISKTVQPLGSKTINGSSSSNQGSATLRASDLQVMPPEWLAKLHLAALEIDDRQVLELIEQIPQSQATLAQTLTNLVDNFRLDIIIDCSSEAQTPSCS